MDKDIREYARKRIEQLRAENSKLSKAELKKMVYEDCCCQRPYFDAEREQIWMIVDELVNNLCDCEENDFPESE